MCVCCVCVTCDSLGAHRKTAVRAIWVPATTSSHHICTLPCIFVNFYCKIYGVLQINTYLPTYLPGTTILLKSPRGCDLR